MENVIQISLNNKMGLWAYLPGEFKGSYLFDLGIFLYHQEEGFFN